MPGMPGRTSNASRICAIGMDSSEIFEKLETHAISLWGQDKWMSELAKAYAKVSRQRGDAGARVVNRRPQLERAFERKSCNVATLLKICEALNLELKLLATVEI